MPPPWLLPTISRDLISCPSIWNRERHDICLPDSRIVGGICYPVRPKFVQKPVLTERPLSATALICVAGLAIEASRPSDPLERRSRGRGVAILHPPKTGIP